MGIGGYIGNHASCSASVTFIIGARDVHIANATRDGVAAIGFVNQSRHIVTARLDCPFGAQVLDGCAINFLEEGNVVSVGIPVEIDRTIISVERAGVIIAHHSDVIAEINVLQQFGVDTLLPAVHKVAELLPVFRCDDIHVFYDHVCHHRHLDVSTDGSGS